MIHQGGVNYWAVFTPLTTSQNIAFIHNFHCNFATRKERK